MAQRPPFCGACSLQGGVHAWGPSSRSRNEDLTQVIYLGSDPRKLRREEARGDGKRREAIEE